MLVDRSGSELEVLSDLLATGAFRHVAMTMVDTNDLYTSKERKSQIVSSRLSHNSTVYVLAGD